MKSFRRVGVFAVVMAAVTTGAAVLGEQRVVGPNGDLVGEGVAPGAAGAGAGGGGRYLEYRAANFVDWHPTKAEMLISTRFGDTAQLHVVSEPGGARRQITFYSDAVTGGSYHPNGGDYIVFSKDIGGGEWYQL